MFGKIKTWGLTGCIRSCVGCTEQTEPPNLKTQSFWKCLRKCFHAETFLLNDAHGSMIEGPIGQCQDEQVSKCHPLFVGYPPIPRVSADLAVRGLAGDCDMFPCGACFPQGHPVQLPWWNRPSHQQKQQASGWSLDGRFQRFLLYYLTRYRDVILNTKLTSVWLLVRFSLWVK